MFGKGENVHYFKKRTQINKPSFFSLCYRDPQACPSHKGGTEVAEDGPPAAGLPRSHCPTAPA